MSDPTAQPKHKLRVPRARRGPLRLLVGTRKGAFVIEVDAARREAEPPRPALLGRTCFHVVADPFRPEVLLAAVRGPSEAPTVMRSEDAGVTWTAAEAPPAFGPAAADAPFERQVHQVFWLSPGHPDDRGTWFAGTCPQGLFRSDDGGRSWAPMEGLHGHPSFEAWTDLAGDRTPDGPKLHSVHVDPRSSGRMVVAMSSGGVLATEDGGASWERLDGGLEHDAAVTPQLVVPATTNPDRLWMQGHHGVHRMDREDGLWVRTGPRADDGSFADRGFPIAVHPHDPDTCWVVPLGSGPDGARLPAGGRPAVHRTRDAGETWERQGAGLAEAGAWWTVKRQALAVDGCDPLGLYLGTSTGEVWASRDEGESWACVASGLPAVYSVEVG
ncbi:MAG: glycosyl hydrolase [Planctomycetota bacterium]|jgi:hypothetical protein